MAYSDEQQQRAVDLWREVRPGLKSDRQAILEVSDRTGVPRDSIRRWVNAANGPAKPATAANTTRSSLDLTLPPSSIESLTAQLDHYTKALHQHQLTVEALLHSGFTTPGEGDTADHGGNDDLDSLMVALRDHQHNLRALMDLVMSTAVARYGYSLKTVGDGCGMSPTGVRHRVAQHDNAVAAQFLAAVSQQLPAHADTLIAALNACDGHPTADVENAFDDYTSLLSNIINALQHAQRWAPAEQDHNATQRLIDTMQSLNKSVYESLKTTAIADDWDRLRTIVSLDGRLDSVLP